MTIKNQNLIEDNKINMKLLVDTADKPDLFSSGEELFWNDPHISQQMLEAHLNPIWDAASQNHRSIDQTVEWLFKYLKLNQGNEILDLGCGPGLYCTRFYQRGLKVTGIDYSNNSIRYANKYANENNMNITYIYQNYLTMDFNGEFDAIFLIYCDFAVLSDVDRNDLLRRIYKALKPNGYFVFDVFTKYSREQQCASNWYVCNSGFWKPNPHLVLEKSFHYEEENVFLDQITVIDENGSVTIYKLWDHYYSLKTISKVLIEHSYMVKEIWNDLKGTSYEENSKSLGIVARKL